MLGGKEYRCGLGFQVAEEIETDELQRWHMYVRPYQDECEIVLQPKMKEELVMSARTLGIVWNIVELLILENVYLSGDGLIRLRKTSKQKTAPESSEIVRCRHLVGKTLENEVHGKLTIVA